MAFNDTLFQLGMDLTRSSPAHEEDTLRAVRVSHEDRHETAAAGSSANTGGQQRLVIDLFGAGKLSSVKTVERAAKTALEFMQSRLLKADLVRQPDTGSIRGTAAFECGEVLIEAWPSTGFVALDVVGGSMRPEIAMTAFADAFGARETLIKKGRVPGDGARWKKAMPGLAKAGPVRLPQARPAAKGAKARAA